jgi:hypothetical protein
VATLFDRLQVIPLRFFHLSAIRGFSGDTVSLGSLVDEVRQFGMSERLMKLERWLVTVGASDVLPRVFESIESSERVPKLRYEHTAVSEHEAAQYVLRERDSDVRALAVLYGSECPSLYGACSLDALQYWDAARIGWIM